ncbi:MAG: MarC family protein [Pseudomonadota bacterium]
MVESILPEFVTLWVVIDPIGTIPVFIAVTAGLTVAKQRMVALKAALVSAGILLFFLVAGQFVLEGLGIGLNSFQIAGGIVLFLFALTMIFGESKPEAESQEAEVDHKSLAVFPLAVPSLASPGAMLAIVVLTDNHRFGVADQLVTAGVMLAVVFVAFILMLLAGPIIKLIGMSGAAIVSRVMGMILAAVAVDNIIQALIALQALPAPAA